jgi:hypothetical protein
MIDPYVNKTRKLDEFVRRAYAFTSHNLSRKWVFFLSSPLTGEDEGGGD